MKKFSTITLFLLVVFASCRPTKSVTNETARIEQRSDSSALKETVKLDTLKTPRDTALVAFPFNLLKDSLLTYMEKSNGRAKVSIYRVHDTLYAKAECDSLEKVIATKERELYMWQQHALQESRKSQTVIVSVPLWFKLLQIGIVVIGFVGILLSILSHFKNFKR